MNWRKDTPVERRRKRVYKTAADITSDTIAPDAPQASFCRIPCGLASRALLPLHIQFGTCIVCHQQHLTVRSILQVVVDMRGPHVKVTSLDKLSAGDKETGWTPTGSARTTLPELQHNVRLLVDMTEVRERYGTV